MNWRSTITSIYESSPHQPGIARRPEFFAAASKTSIADAETELNVLLPDSLKSLLLESDGVMDMMAIDDGEWFESGWLLWNIEEIVKENWCYRSANRDLASRRDFSKLLFFANAGVDGILFAFLVENGVCSGCVAVWHPIMDELDEVASSLDEFLHGWSTGLITV